MAITIDPTPEQKARMLEAAKAEGLGLEEWARRKILASLPDAKESGDKDDGSSECGHVGDDICETSVRS